MPSAMQQAKNREDPLLTPDPTASPSEPRELNLRILHPLIEYVRRMYGLASLHQIADAAELDLDDLKRSTWWVSHRQFEVILAESRALMNSDAQFQQACVYNIQKTYGPMALILRAGSVRLAYQGMSRTIHMVSRVGSQQIVDIGRCYLRLQVKSTCLESRLACLSRQAQLRSIPTLWGLPEAVLTEESCQGRGDDHCQYLIHWRENFTWWRPVLGLLAGLGSSVAYGLAGLPNEATLLGLPLFGLLTGALWAYRKNNQDNLEYSREVRDALSGVLEENQEALEDVLALHHRQEEWNHNLEKTLSHRTEQLVEVIERLRCIQKQSRSTMRGISHDIRSPIMIIQCNTELLRDYINSQDVEANTILADVASAAGSIEVLVRELIGMTEEKSEQESSSFQPDLLDVSAFAAQSQRELEALVKGRNVQVSVRQCQGTPGQIETCKMLFHRVTDNLLTNAAKYTEHGVIEVELGGDESELWVRIADTGKGIARDKIENIFLERNRDDTPLVGDSYGLGLATAVRLLDQLGGRLEVHSQPGFGTAFCAHFPTTIDQDRFHRSKRAQFDSLQTIVERVVSIRSATFHIS